MSVTERLITSTKKLRFIRISLCVSVSLFVCMSVSMITEKLWLVWMNRDGTIMNGSKFEGFRYRCYILPKVFWICILCCAWGHHGDLLNWSLLVCYPVKLFEPRVWHRICFICFRSVVSCSSSSIVSLMTTSSQRKSLHSYWLLSRTGNQGAQKKPLSTT